MTNTNITNLSKNLYSMIDNAIKYDEPINVSTKNGNAIIMSEEEYNNLIETLFISSKTELKEEIIKRSKDPETEFIDENGVDL